jgi:hypothetical protein
MLNVVSAVFALAAGFFWFWSTKPAPDKNKVVQLHDGGAQSNEEWSRVFNIAAKRNAAGAICAGVSAVIMGAATLFGEFG